MEKRQPRLLPLVTPEQDQVDEATKTGQQSIATEIVEGIKPLIKFTGRHCIDRKPEEVTKVINSWLATPVATRLMELTSNALKSKDAHQALCEVVYGVAAATKNMHPQRVCTAICCDILEKVSSKLEHIKHVRTLKTELFRSIYKDYDEASCQTMSDFLLLTPFYEQARSLSKKVNKLMKERKILEESENNAQVRRETRKNVISRTTKRWQTLLISSVFNQWRDTVRRLRQQRTRLKSYFRGILLPSLSDLFHAWKGYVVNRRLQAALSSKRDQEDVLELLESELQKCQETERHLEAELSVMQKEVLEMQAKMVQTLNKIDAQKVKDTMQVLEAVGRSLIATGDLVVAALKPTLDDIAQSPNLKKMAAMFWVDEEEEVQIAADKAILAKQQQTREKQDRHWKMEQTMRLRKQANELTRLEKNIQLKQEQERIKAKADWTAKIKKQKAEGAEVDESFEALQAYKEKRAKRVERDLREMARELWDKEDKAVEEVVRQRNAELMVKMKEQSDEWVVGQRAADKNISSERVKAAVEGLATLPADQLLLRWVKFHLRRAVWNNTPYRRRCLNFHEDLRDGLNYAVLMTRIAPKESVKLFHDTSIAMEIDPAVRLDAVLEVAAVLSPPATGFTTRSHILADDAFLNAAFLSRLMLTHHGLVWDEDAEIVTQVNNFETLMARWKKVKAYIRSLTPWESWVKLRSETKNSDLKKMLVEVRDCVEEFKTMYASLRSVSQEAQQARMVWWGVTKKLRSFQWKIFSSKVLQEEEPPRNKPKAMWDRKYAPFRLVDFRHASRFKSFTEIDVPGYCKLLHFAGLPASPQVPGFDKEKKAIHELLVTHYKRLRRIFQHYIAHVSESTVVTVGQAEMGKGMSLSQWWAFVKDCGLQHNTRLAPKHIQAVFTMISHRQRHKREELKKLIADADDDEQADEFGELPIQIDANAWVHGLVALGFKRCTSHDTPSTMVKCLVEDYLLPRACKSNVDTFRGEVSMDKVQRVFGTYRELLRKIFLFYARVPELVAGQVSQAPCIDITRWMKMLKETAILTSEEDHGQRNDFPAEAAQVVFQEVQLEEDSETSVEIGGGDGEMIWMEFLEALAAISCYKQLNPYIPLHTKLEDFLSTKLIPGQLKFGLKKKKRKKRKKERRK